MYHNFLNFLGKRHSKAEFLDPYSTRLMVKNVIKITLPCVFVCNGVIGSQSGVWSGGGAGAGGALRVRGAGGTGGARRAPGFQPTLVALQQGAPHPIATLTINSSYGLSV